MILIDVKHVDDKVFLTVLHKGFKIFGWTIVNDETKMYVGSTHGYVWSDVEDGYRVDLGTEIALERMFNAYKVREELKKIIDK